MKKLSKEEKKIQTCIALDREMLDKIKEKSSEFGVSISQYLVLAAQGKIPSEFLIKKDQ